MADDKQVILSEGILNKDGSAGYGDTVETRVAELMTATKEGDPRAFDDLIETMRGRAFRVARSLVGSTDDAQDLCQEAFLRTYRARETFRDGDPFLPWFHRILRNTCYSFLRKNRRLKKHSITRNDGEETDWEIIDHDAPSPSAALEQSELQLAFWEAFNALRARDREILSLRHFDELAYREIAVSLNIPEGTVMSRLYHARRRLRDRLQSEMGLELATLSPANQPEEASRGKP